MPAAIVPTKPQPPRPTVKAPRNIERAPTAQHALLPVVTEAPASDS